MEERALAPQSINLLVKRRCAGWIGCNGVCRTWSEIGVRGCAPEHPVAQVEWQRSVKQVPGYESEVIRDA
jgi:hypothetical protein